MMIRRKYWPYVVLLAFFGHSLPAHATDFYVARNGDDSNSGRSPDQAFLSISRAAKALGSGDSLYLHAGDRWTPGSVLTVSVSGSESNPVVIGAFEVDAAGRVNHRVADRRPIIDGQTTVPSRGTWSGLITVRGTNVRVQDIEVRNSGGIGVVFQDTSNGVADNVKTEWTYFNGILANRSDAITVIGADVSGFGRGSRDFGERPFPTGLSVVSGSGFVVTDSYVHEGWGEGISAFRGASNIVIENNVVYAVRNVGIYLDASRNAEIRGNLVLGTSDSAYYRSTNFVGAGIALSNELYQYQGHGGGLSQDFITENVSIFNNLVAGTSAGITFWGELPDVAFNNIQVIHNTFVDNRAQFRSYGFPFTDVDIANNIFLSVSADAEDVSPGDFESRGNVEFSSNYWSQGRPPWSMRSSNDIYDGLTLTRSGGWREISDASEVSWQDFQPAAGSVTIGAGDATYLSQVPMDFNGTPHSTLPDIGALSKNSPTQIARRPRSPTAVRLLLD